MGFQVPTIQYRSGSIKFGTLYYDLPRKPSNDPNHPCENYGLVVGPLEVPQNLDVAAATKHGLGRIAAHTDRQLAARAWVPISGKPLSRQTPGCAGRPGG